MLGTRHVAVPVHSTHAEPATTNIGPSSPLTHAAAHLPTTPSYQQPPGAEANAGEVEVRDALQAKAEFLCGIGDHAAGGHFWCGVCRPVRCMPRASVPAWCAECELCAASWVLRALQPSKLGAACTAALAWCAEWQCCCASMLHQPWLRGHAWWDLRRAPCPQTARAPCSGGGVQSGRGQDCGGGSQDGPLLLADQVGGAASSPLHAPVRLHGHLGGASSRSPVNACCSCITSSVCPLWHVPAL